MLLGAVLMLLGHVGAWMLAVTVQSRLRTGSRATDVVAVFVLHALVVSLIVLLVGSLRVLTLGGLSVAGILAGVGAIALGGHRIAIEWFVAIRQYLRDARAESRTVVVMAGVVALVVLVRHLYNLWWFAPHNADEVDYHLPRLAAWIQSGALVRPDMVDVRTYFPAGQQLLQAWWVGFLHHDGFIEGAAIEEAAMAAVATAAITRRLGGTRAEALLAGALFATLPVILLHATCALNDIAACAFILSAFALVLHRGGIPFAVVALVVGVGIKPSVAFALPGLVLLAWHYRKTTAIPSPRVLLGGVLVFAALVGAYTYALNWRQFGNPLHPVTLFGAEAVLPGTTVVTRPAPDRLLQTLYALFTERLFILDSTVDADLANQAGWGWTIALAGFPALIWTVWRAPAWRWLAAGFSLSFLTTLSMVEFDPYNARFVIWFPALLAGAAASRAFSIKPAWALAAIALTGSAANIALTAIPKPFRAERGTAIYAASWRDRDAWQAFYTFTGNEDAAFTSSSDRTLCITYLAATYALARGDYRRPLEHASRPDADAIVEAMRVSGCRYLYIVNVGEPYSAAIQQAAATGRLKVLTRGWLELIR